MKTIARNRTKKIAEIKAAVTGVVRYDESTGNMVPSTAEAALATLAQFDFARLKDNENGTYTVTVHSNLWYELDTRPKVTPEQAEKPAGDIERDARRRAQRNAATLARTVSIHDLRGTGPVADDMPIGTRVVRVADGEPGAVESRYSDGKFAVVMDIDGKAFVDRREAFTPVRPAHLQTRTGGSACGLERGGDWNATFRNDKVACPKCLEAISCSECAEMVGETEIGRNGGACDDCAAKVHEQIDNEALDALVDEIERTPANPDGSVTLLPPASFDSPVKTGEEILAGESDLGRELAARTAGELTRVQRRALRNGVTRPAARPALDGLRLRSLVAGGRGDGPVRLTAMGRAVAALLKGAPIPA